MEMAFASCQSNGETRKQILRGVAFSRPCSLGELDAGPLLRYVTRGTGGFEVASQRPLGNTEGMFVAHAVGTQESLEDANVIATQMQRICFSS